MAGMRQNEAQLFFRIVAQLRIAQHERPWSAPDDAERADLLDDIRTIASHTENDKLRKRCTAALKEFGALEITQVAL